MKPHGVSLNAGRLKPARGGDILETYSRTPAPTREAFILHMASKGRSGEISVNVEFSPCGLPAALGRFLSSRPCS